AAVKRGKTALFPPAASLSSCIVDSLGARDSSYSDTDGARRKNVRMFRNYSKKTGLAPRQRSAGPHEKSQRTLSFSIAGAFFPAQICCASTRREFHQRQRRWTSVSRTARLRATSSGAWAGGFCIQ